MKGGTCGGTTQASMSLSSIGNKADLNNDDMVNFKDFADFAGNWHMLEPFLAEDLDRNGQVDMFDLGQFADSWLWEQ